VLVYHGAESAWLAQDRPDVLARIDQLKHYLRYVHLRWQLDHEKDKEKRKALTVAALIECCNSESPSEPRP
jgi:hypothetical protein